MWSVVIGWNVDLGVSCKNKHIRCEHTDDHEENNKTLKLSWNLIYQKRAFTLGVIRDSNVEFPNTILVT
jgi:hypothetical protein